MKRRIAVDIDGTIADMVSPLRVFYNEKTGTNLMEEDFSYELWKTLGLKPGEEWGVLNDFHSSSYFERILPIEGSQTGISRLFCRGYDLNILTARPESWKLKTIDWIENNFPNVFSQIHFTDKKSEVCIDRGYNLFIEDSPKHANECAEMGINVFLIRRYWNWETLKPGVIPVKNWEEILQKLI
jgi:uncharacterized HAD superfamily protein